ncbi:MAG: OstA-like protein [Daejeonella sp.]
MKKLLFSITLFLLTGAVLAQQPKKLQLVSSQLLKGLQTAGLVRVIKPVFSHDGSTLAADSANFSQERNTFDAFGHVVITQPSGTTVYSDLLNYNGNTKTAVLTNNVKLVDGDATLTTNLLTYNLATKIGTYYGGGKIVNGQNILTSKNGYYFANSRDAYFRHDVTLNTPDVIITTDTLRYNSGSKISYFYGPTNIFNKKNKSNLYTENGDYNTQTEQARFGKKNLYTDGSKSLKGDSLFYDGKAGYGKALNNITFIDTAEKVTFKGDVGIYRKADESILATKNAYVIITAESDSGKVDSIWLTADTLFSKVVFNRLIKPFRKEELKKDTDLEDDTANVKKSASRVSNSKEEKLLPGSGAKNPNLKDDKNDSLAKSDSIAKDTLPPVVKVTDSLKIKPPPITKDTLKALPLKKADKKVKPDKKAKQKNLPPKPAVIDTLKKPLNTKSQDTLLLDTARSRIVMAYHKAKIFKSDLQAKSDSMFFSYSDSTLRCYTNPMIWTQGSQLSGDTVYLQLKNKKLDNMQLQRNSFIVNTESTDSINFNQVKGKVITGYFKDSKLNRVFVDGNAESIYYIKEDTTYSGMNRMLSSRIKILFDGKELKNITSIRKPEGSYYPIDKLPKDETILEGFIWKPKDRPRSKEEIIPSLTKTKVVKKEPNKEPVKTPVKKSETPVKKRN